MNRVLALSPLLLLLFVLGAKLNAAGETPADSERDRSSAKTNREKQNEDASDTHQQKLAITQHTLYVAGQEIRYTATAGYLVVKAEGDRETSGDAEDAKDKPGAGDDGLKPKARFFFVAYTLDGAEASIRPITFAFNGGPGSSSVWLHLGALGPRRVVVGPAGGSTPPPYRLTDNQSTWLTESDLVFIDPVSTGYSRPAAGEKAAAFHGYKEDLESVGEFIRLYITRWQRWLSPKFLLGESYGGTRAAALADFLQERHGIYVNGVMLASPALNFQTIDFSPGNDVAYAVFLPGYAATAWYHRKLSPDLLSKSVTEVGALARRFALGDYLMALAKGGTLPAGESEQLAAQLAAFSGISMTRFLRQNLRVPPWQFMAALLEDQGKIVGRFDSRITGLRFSPESNETEYDPSYAAVAGPFTAAINAYLRGELKFETDLPYGVLVDVAPWNFQTAQNRYLNVSDDLRRAMTRNPYLKTWISCGYFDLATPFSSSIYSADQLMLDPALSPNVTLTVYEAGHMFYTVESVLAQFKSDFETFRRAATSQGPIDDAAR